jgi:PAS domain S-box-containing protein
VKVKKSLYSSEEMLARFREQAENMLAAKNGEQDLNFTTRDIQELLHQIQVQHIELEMQNDELKLSNEEVESQRQKFSGLYDLAPVGYFILDAHGIIMEANTTGCNLLETPKRMIVNRRFQSFVDPDAGNVFYTFLRQTVTAKAQRSCQLSLLTPKGKSLYVQLEGVAIHQSINQQQPQCYIAVIDFTERRQADLKLRDTKERLEMALDASVAGTWQIDLITQEISLDDFSCGIYGLQICDNIQSIDSFIRMIHTDDRPLASKQFGEAVSNKGDLDIEYRIIRPDGSMAYISARGHVVGSSETPVCFVGILIDITERKLLEEEASRLKREHQRNILTAIFRTQENERKRISETLHDSVSQLLYGIKLKLQDYRKSEKDSQIYAELNTLIEQAVNETRTVSFELAPSILTDFGLPTTLEEMSKRLNSRKLKILTRISGLNERLELQKELSLFRIIQELVNNVIKHAKASELVISLRRENKRLTINVTDNGRGFDRDHELSSAGSGLHSIKNRLDLLNGIMEINSTDGAGTSVKITFEEIA